MAGALIGATALGGLFGAGSSALSGLMNYKSAKKLQQHQYDLNRKALREQYQNTRYSLTQAGYNPLLAVGSSVQGFSANSSGVNPDISSGVSSGVNSALQAVQAKSQIANVNADTALKNNQGETEKAKRIQMEFQNAMYDVETHLKQKDLSTYERRFYSNLYEQMQRAENYRANSAVSRMNAETNRMNAITNQTNSAVSAKRARFQNYKDYMDAKYGNPLKTTGFSWDKNTMYYQGGYPDF